MSVGLYFRISITRRHCSPEDSDHYHVQYDLDRVFDIISNQINKYVHCNSSINVTSFEILKKNMSRIKDTTGSK